MPRTKVSRNAKRNRDAAKEEALLNRMREFDLFVDQWQSTLDLEHQQRLDENRAVTNLIQMIPQKMLSMKMGELMAMEAKTIEEANAMMEIKNNANRSVVNSSLLKSTKKKSRDDEGYLTEDSANGSTANTRITSTAPYTGMQRGMTPSVKVMGPLSSAKAKSRHRRSRSACGYLSAVPNSRTTMSSSTTSSSQTNTDRMSRSKIRTPLSNRVKAASADRAAPVTPKICPNTPLSMLRYPRIGETVISLTGSPIVAQCVSDSMASVNIPIKDGVLSLRPTRLEAIDKDFLERIDHETLLQIKELQSNLNKFMRIVDKANGKN